MGEGNLFPYMIVLLLAENNQRLATCLFKLLKWCPINEKINVRHLQSNVSAVLFTATLYIIGWTYQTILVFIILLLMDIWIVYSLWLLWIEQLWIFLDVSLGRCRNLPPYSMHLAVELLCVGLCLVLLNIAKQFYKVAVQIYTPVSSPWEFQSFLILLNSEIISLISTIVMRALVSIFFSLINNDVEKFRISLLTIWIYFLEMPVWPFTHFEIGFSFSYYFVAVLSIFWYHSLADFSLS